MRGDPCGAEDVAMYHVADILTDRAPPSFPAPRLGLAVEAPFTSLRAPAACLLDGDSGDLAVCYHVFEPLVTDVEEALVPFVQFSVCARECLGLGPPVTPIGELSVLLLVDRVDYLHALGDRTALSEGGDESMAVLAVP